MSLEVTRPRSPKSPPDTSGLGYIPSVTPFMDDDFSPAVRTQKSGRLSRPSLSYWQDAWIRLRRNKQALASLIVVGLMLGFTLAGPAIWGIDQAAQDLSRVSEGPTRARSAVIIQDASEFTPTILEDVPATPEPPESLGVTTRLEVIGTPSTQAVNLAWDPVPGAAGYMIYRDDGWIAETDGGNQVSYQDNFNVSVGDHVYRVVAKNGMEAPEGREVRVSLARSIKLSDAQSLDPRAQVGQTVIQPGHPLGTDYLGRDMLSRLMAGARVSLFIGFFAPLISVFLGILIGGIAGFAGGRVDQSLMRFTDFVLALPFLLFVILFKIAFGAEPGQSGIFPMLVAMVLLSWTGPARLVRGQVLQLRESEFVQAAKLLGARPAYIIARHLLPNTLGVILVSLTFAIPTAIFTEAFLSFIGMGVVPPTPSWGGMCNEGIQRFLTVPHEFLFPAILISITVLAFNLLGDGLRDALDPRMRSTE